MTCTSRMLATPTRKKISTFRQMPRKPTSLDSFLLGLVAKYGCITYLPGENVLYISGLNTAGVPVVCKLRWTGRKR